MTLDEALGSTWRTTGKTVEELLRAGKLTYQDLRVAANRSEDEREKQIAGAVWKNYEAAHARIHPTRVNQTFLVNLPNVGLSLEEAHATPWKGAQHSGEPMGKLVDQGKLSMRDLSWAVESNFVPRVREAARVLLFQMLQTRFEAPAKNGVPKVIQAGASYSREKVADITSLALGLYAFGAGGMAFVGILAVLKISVWTLLYIFGAICAASVPYMWMRMKSIHAHNRGVFEEDRVAARLAASLDGSWTILRNVRKKGIGGDIDIVLVGPGGVYALEVKNWNVDLRIEGSRSFVAMGGKRKGGYGDPILQARNNARSLQKVLAGRGIQVPVVPVLVVAVENLELVSPEIAVWNSEDVPQEASWLPTNTRSAFDAAKVVALLEVEGGK